MFSLFGDCAEDFSLKTVITLRENRRTHYCIDNLHSRTARITYQVCFYSISWLVSAEQVDNKDEKNRAFGHKQFIFIYRLETVSTKITVDVSGNN